MGKVDGYLIATDLDGTLNNSEHEISRENREAIAYFQSEGGHVTLATGRSPQGVDQPLAAVRFNAPIILSNGCLIVHHETREVLFETYLNPQSRAFCQAAKDAFPEVTLEVHKKEGVWVFDFNTYSKLHLEIVGIPPVLGGKLDEAADPWRKTLFLGTPKELTALLAWAASWDTRAYSFCFSNPVMLEMQSVSANKGNGVAFVADYLGISHDKVYCVGDEQNDLPMLTRFHGYAPDNASAEIKAMVPLPLPSCDEHAIAALIDRIEKSV